MLAIQLLFAIGLIQATIIRVDGPWRIGATNRLHVRSDFGFDLQSIVFIPIEHRPYDKSRLAIEIPVHTGLMELTEHFHNDYAYLTYEIETNRNFHPGFYKVIMVDDANESHLDDRVTVEFLGQMLDNGIICLYGCELIYGQNKIGLALTDSSPSHDIQMRLSQVKEREDGVNLFELPCSTRNDRIRGFDGFIVWSFQIDRSCHEGNYHLLVTIGNAAYASANVFYTLSDTSVSSVEGQKQRIQRKEDFFHLLFFQNFLSVTKNETERWTTILDLLSTPREELRWMMDIYPSSRLAYLLPEDLRSLAADTFVNAELVSAAIQIYLNNGFDIPGKLYNGHSIRSLAYFVPSQYFQNGSYARIPVDHERFFLYTSWKNQNHWILIVYDKVIEKYYVIDSAIEDDLANYNKEVGLFAFVLSTATTMNIPVPCEIFIQENGRYACAEIIDPDIYNKIIFSEGVGRQPDSYNCGIFTIINAIIFMGIVLKKAATNEPLEGIDQEFPHFGFSEDELFEARKSLLVALGSLCLSNDNLMIFPDCLGFAAGDTLNDNLRMVHRVNRN